MSNICFINFSPRDKQSTTYYLGKQLNLQADSFHINEILAHDDFESLDKYGVIILGSPVYVDGLPSKGLKFLESYADYLISNPQVKNVYGISCCGFPESHQTQYALKIMSHFAEAVAFKWQGGLGTGSGEFIGQSQAIPLDSKFKRPLKEKLDSLQHAILEDKDYGFQYCDSFMPRWFYIASGTLHWHRMLKSNGKKRKELKNNPLI